MLPTPASRWFLTLRAMTTVLLPEALVMGGRTRVGLHAPGVGEAGAVVADLRQDAGATEAAETGEAGDDPGVGVFLEGLGGGLGKVIGAGAGGVQLTQERESLPAHGLLHQRKSTHLGCAECVVEPLGLGLDRVLAAGLLQQGPELVRVSLAACCGVGAAARRTRAIGWKIPSRRWPTAARKPGKYSRR